MSRKKFSLIKRLHSFRFAISGLVALFLEEHNARIHLLATVLAIALGFYLNISALEWILIGLAITLVLVVEAINSAIEAIADAITEEKNAKIGKAKDLAAAAVLISAIFAAIIGFTVFLPKLYR